MGDLKARLDRDVDGREWASSAEWAKSRGYSGFDPYDALLSPLLAGMRRVLGANIGIIATQLVRRSPVNLRPVLGVPRVVNPKALALFLAAAVRENRSGDARSLAVQLVERVSTTFAEPCWGYPFPWQGRAFYLPADTPTVVVTSFAGEAFLDLHEATGESRWLDVALGACRFLLESLHRTEDVTGACLSYSPLDRTTVYNASLLGARLLALTGQRAGRNDLVSEAEPLVRYVLARQREDGGWAYGDARFQGWIDSFHTGFVLGALHRFAGVTADPAAEQAVERGLRFYDQRFFGPNGEPYYFADRRYPYDIHSAAQAVLTFLELSDRFPELRERAGLVGGWMVRNMLDSEGFFHYQIRRTHRVRIPYMRWSQAWGVRALAEMARHGVEP